MIRPFEEIEELDNKMTSVFKKRPDADARRAELKKDRFGQWLAEKKIRPLDKEYTHIEAFKEQRDGRL